MSDLLNGIETRLRRIIREEVRTAILESQGSNAVDEHLSISNEHNLKGFPTILTASEVASLLGIKVQSEVFGGN